MNTSSTSIIEILAFKKLLWVFVQNSYQPSLRFRDSFHLRKDLKYDSREAEFGVLFKNLKLIVKQYSNFHGRLIYRSALKSKIYNLQPIEFETIYSKFWSISKAIGNTPNDSSSL